MNPTATLALAAGCLVCAAVATAQTSHPDISGHWTYNAAQSGNPRGMLSPRDSGGEPEGGAERGGGGFGGRPGGFGGGYGGGRGGYGGMRAPQMTDEQRERMRQMMELVFQAPPGLVIEQSDSTVTFGADTSALVLPSNGKKVKVQAEGQADVDVKGRWQGNSFVVERSVSQGGRVTEDYLRSPDGKQLFVIVNFTTPRGREITFRRVYDTAH